MNTRTTFIILGLCTLLLSVAGILTMLSMGEIRGRVIALEQRVTQIEKVVGQE